MALDSFLFKDAQLYLCMHLIELLIPLELSYNYFPVQVSICAILSTSFVDHFLSIHDQIFSMGFRSGDRAGQGRTVIC